jgi:hypothetical protein
MNHTAHELTILNLERPELKEGDDTRDLLPREVSDLMAEGSTDALPYFQGKHEPDSLELTREGFVKSVLVNGTKADITKGELYPVSIRISYPNLFGRSIARLYGEEPVYKAEVSHGTMPLTPDALSKAHHQYKTLYDKEDHGK